MPRSEVRLSERPLPRPLGEILAAPPGMAVQLYWLGQAGFVIDGGGRRLVIDPYLSDSLADKYRGSRFDHVRMMPAPVAAGGIAHVDAVLATHAHSDHLDPGTLPALMAANPAAPLMAPAAAAALACARAAIPASRLVALDAGQRASPAPGISVTASRAAHEELRRDEMGRHHFLGYAMQIGGACIFHSGDTVPFDGQVPEVAALGADLALFPVNGRDAERAANGVPGNLHLSEALELARAAAIPAVIAHHFDMFAFNTMPRADIEALGNTSAPVLVRAAKAGVVYSLTPPPQNWRMDKA